MRQIRENHKKLHVLTTLDEWFGLTYRQDKDLAREKISQLDQAEVSKS